MDFLTIQKREIGKDEVNSILASELHEKLEVKTPLNKWIERRTTQNDNFIDGYNYITVWGKKVLPFIADKNVQGSEKFIISELSETKGLTDKELNLKGFSKNAILTLDTAKHIAMMENNAKGHEVRDYFIDIEKRVYQEMIKLQNFKETYQVKQVSKLNQRQFITSETIEKALNYHGLISPRRSTLVFKQDGSKEKMYAKIEAKQDSEIQQAINKYTYSQKQEHQRLLTAKNIARNALNNKLLAIDKAIQLLMVLDGYQDVILRLQHDRHDEIAMFNSFKKRITEEYQENKQRLEEAKSVEVKAIKEKTNQEVKARKLAVDTRIAFDHQKVQEFKDGKLIEDELEKYLNLPFDPLAIIASMPQVPEIEIDEDEMPF